MNKTQCMIHYIHTYMVHEEYDTIVKTPASFCPLVQPKWKCDDDKPLRDRVTYNQ